jgi:hypothetical protein
MDHLGQNEPQEANMNPTEFKNGPSNSNTNQKQIQQYLKRCAASPNTKASTTCLSDKKTSRPYNRWVDRVQKWAKGFQNIFKLIPTHTVSSLQTIYEAQEIKYVAQLNMALPCTRWHKQVLTIRWTRKPNSHKQHMMTKAMQKRVSTMRYNSEQRHRSNPWICSYTLNIFTRRFHIFSHLRNHTTKYTPTRAF